MSCTLMELLNVTDLIVFFLPINHHIEFFIIISDFDSKINNKLINPAYLVTLVLCLTLVSIRKLSSNVLTTQKSMR